MEGERFPTRWGTFLVHLFTVVMVVQGIHVIEHIIQLVQVYQFDVPEDEALGLLGYVFEFHGTEEWLHLVFNTSYFLPLVALLVFLVRPLSPAVVPRWSFLTFALGGVALEGWHVAEHSVIISHVIANEGCPCPGILDPVLGIGDTVLHFFYNTVTYLAILPAYRYVMKYRVWLSDAARPASVVGDSWETPA